MHPTPEVSALPDPHHLTLYVLLAGVMGGLVLAVAVMVCCKVCLKKKKPLTRQHVVFSRSSERQHSRARKYHSLDSSVSVDIETSWGGMSDSSPSPREPKEFCAPEEGARSVPPYASVSPRSLPDIPESKTPEEDLKCIAGPSQPKKTSDPLTGRRRSSAGIQRQASVCLSDEDDDASLYQVERKEVGCEMVELRAVKVDGDKSFAIEGHRSSCSSPRGTPPTPPSVSSVSFHPHKTYTSTTQTHTAVVHRNGDMNLTSAGRSPDRNSQCSCCRNSRGSQGSHSHNSSVDSGSARTVIAVNDHSYGVVSGGGGSTVSNGFSNGENDDPKHLKSFAEEEDEPADATARSRRQSTETAFEQDKVKRRSSNGQKEKGKTPNGESSTKAGPCRLSREIHSSSSLDAAASGEGWAEIPEPLRKGASTEQGLLERALELHQEETRRRLKTLQRPESGIEGNSGDDDSEAKRPVRYNDTGSREEIREEDLSGISPSPPTTSESEVIEEELEEMEDGTDYESLREAYRQLWELRATFEEEEELSDTLRFDEDEEDDDDDEAVEEKGCEGAEAGEECPVDADEDPRTGTPGVTPEREPSSQATSFESNTEPCAQDDENDAGTATKSSEASSGEKKEETEPKIYSNLLSLPTPESRRSSFTSRVGKRLKRSSGTQGGSDCQEASAATGTSFDSVDTEWSSTEASRTGEDQSTSFESTTTTDYNTDSSATESLQARRLQQMKADSGYKSMESNGRRPPKLSRGKPMRSTVDSMSIDELDESKSLRESLVITRTEPSAVVLIGKDVTAAMVERSKSMSALKKRLQPWKDWPATTTTLQISTSMSPGTVGSPVTTTVTAVVVPMTSSGAIGFLPSKTEETVPRVLTSVKAEVDSDRISGGGLSPSPSTTSSIASDLRGKISVFQRFFRSSRPAREERISRDFSIDEKSDSLFREFSRQDPSLDTTDSHRSRSSASWRARDARLHHTHPYHHPPHHGLVHLAHHPPPHQHHAPLPVHHRSHPTSVSNKWSEMREDMEMVVLGGKSTSAFSPQLSIDEECSGLEGCSSGPLSRSGVSERSLVLQDIPVIRLPALDD